MTSAAFSQAVTRALNSSAMYTYGSLIKPNVRSIPKEEVRATVPPPMAQWVLQGNNFDTALMDQYRRIKVGETKLLVAATGIGKTTTVPLKLVSSSGKAALILVPLDIYIVKAMDFIIGSGMAGEYNVYVDYLRSKYIKNPVTGPTLYFSTVNNFLPRFHADRSLMRRLNIEFVCLDESHFNSPLYKVIRYLVGNDFFPDTKVFFLTATSPDTSMILSRSDNNSKPQPRPSSEFIIENPEATPHTSPLYYGNIVSRTTIFLPTDHHLDIWEKYYDDHDIVVVKYNTYDTSRKIKIIDDAFKRKAPAVFLTVSFTETSLTFSIDSVIDTGYTQVFEVDYNKPGAGLKIIPVTMAQRIQRMGRANRHLPGVAYYNDVKVSPPSPEVDETTAIYVWMWLRMFRIQIKDPLISSFSEFMGDFSDEFIANMLCSRLHPLLIMPYLTHDGELFKGWDIMRHVFHTHDPPVISEYSNEESVEKWQVRNTGPQVWIDEPTDYKTCTEFPDEWQVLPVAAWKSFITGNTNIGVSFDNASVVSALVPESSKQTKKNSKAVSILSLPETIDSRPRSVMTVNRPVSTVGDKFVSETKDVDELYPKVSALSGMSSLAVSRPRHMRSASATDTEEIQRSDVGQWAESVSNSGQRRRRRASRKSSSSGSSHDKDFIDLRKVDPTAYKFHKLYPLDNLLLSQYLNSESATDEDFYRFERLIKIRQNFTTLSPDPQTQKELQNTYFVSVLKVHNNQVMEKLQIRASGMSRPTFMDRFLGRDYTAVDSVIDRSTRLLKNMDFEGFFVGIDIRTMHTGVSFDLSAYDSLETMRITASYLLHTADEELKQQVKLLSGACFSVGKLEVVGTAWCFGHAVVMPYHIYDVELLDRQHQLIHYDKVKDIAVCRMEEKLEVHPKVRGAVDSETVLVVGIDPVTKERSALGPVDVISVGDVWCMSKTLCKGFSGAALLSVEDYALVGLYLGYYMTTNEKKQYSHFVSASEFISEVARIY